MFGKEFIVQCTETVHGDGLIGGKWNKYLPKLGNHSSYVYERQLFELVNLQILH